MVILNTLIGSFNFYPIGVLKIGLAGICVYRIRYYGQSYKVPATSRVVNRSNLLVTSL